MKYIRLGDLLVKSGTITQGQLNEALAIQSDSGERLGTVLQKHGFITEKQLIDTLMDQLGVEFVDLNTWAIPPEMAQLLPRAIAKKYMVVPIRANRTDVKLAMADPLNFVAVEEVQAVTRRRVIPVIAASAALERAVQNSTATRGPCRPSRTCAGTCWGASTAPSRPRPRSWQWTRRRRTPPRPSAW